MTQNYHEEALPDLNSLLGLDVEEEDENEDFDEISLEDLIVTEEEKEGPASTEEDEVTFDWEDEDFDEISLEDLNLTEEAQENPASTEEDEIAFDWGNEEEFSETEENSYDSEDDWSTPQDDLSDPFSEAQKESPTKNEEVIESEDDLSLVIDDAEEKQTPKKGESFRSKFNRFKEQALAELKGEDAPKDSQKGKELAPIDKESSTEEPEDETGAPEEEKKDKKKSGNKNPFKMIYEPIWKLYLSLVNIIFNALNGILGFLGKIPLLGIPFKFLKQFTKPLKIIATSLPILLICGVLVYLNLNAVDKETVTSLPDNGSVVFTDFSWDGENNTAVGVLKNNGETIATVQPEFKIYSMSPGLNPISWFMPKEQITCSGQHINIDIDKTSQVKVKCKTSPAGFQVRVTGTVK